MQVLCKKCHQKEHHAVTYLVLDVNGNVLHTLVSKEAVLDFINSLGYFPKDTSVLEGLLEITVQLMDFTGNEF